MIMSTTPATLERIYTVPLREAFDVPRFKRTPRAIKILRAFIERHMKAHGMKIVLSQALNEHLWARSIQKPPRRVKVRLVSESGVVNAYLADEKETEAKKKEKAAKASAAKTARKEESAKKKAAVSAAKAPVKAVSAEVKKTSAATPASKHQEHVSAPHTHDKVTPAHAHTTHATGGEVKGGKHTERKEKK